MDMKAAFRMMRAVIYQLNTVLKQFHVHLAHALDGEDPIQRETV